MVQASDSILDAVGNATGTGIDDHSDDGHGTEEHHNAHHQVMEDLEYLTLIWAGVLLCNLASKKIGISSIVLQLLLGCILVNADILPKEPSSFMLTFSELAITVTMFSLGLEEDVKNFIQGIKKAWGIALIGALGPFIAGYGVTIIFYGEQKVALLAGLCMTATAVSISLVTLKGAGLATSQAATGIMTSAVLDDIGCLALIAISIPLLTSNDGVEAVDIIIIVAKAVGFFAIITFICKFVFPERVRLNWCGQPDKFVYKLGYRHLLRHDKYQTMLWVLFTALCFGLLASQLGFHPGIGAYMGALIMNEGYFQDTFHKETEAEMHLLEVDHDGFEATLHNVDTLAMTWLGPVFFVLLGTKMVFVGNEDVVVESLGQVACLFSAMLVFQFVSASVAARYVPGGFNFVESVMIGLGMLGRAELAFVVLDIAYVQHSVINLKCFYMLMFTCFLLNIACPILIMAWKPYYQGEKASWFMGGKPQIGRMATMAPGHAHGYTAPDPESAASPGDAGPDAQPPMTRISEEKTAALDSPAPAVVESPRFSLDMERKVEDNQVTLTGASGAALAAELKKRAAGQSIIAELEAGRIMLVPTEPVSGRIKQQIRAKKKEQKKKVEPNAALISLHFPPKPSQPMPQVKEDPDGVDHNLTLTGLSGTRLANELASELKGDGVHSHRNSSVDSQDFRITRQDTIHMLFPEEAKDTNNPLFEEGNATEKEKDADPGPSSPDEPHHYNATLSGTSGAALQTEVAKELKRTATIKEAP